MLRGLWALTWLEIKIFLREPLGAIGTVAVPVAAASSVIGRMIGAAGGRAGQPVELRAGRAAGARGLVDRHQRRCCHW